jgi:hypothetical protein
MNLPTIDLKKEYYFRKVGSSKVRGPVALSLIIDSIGGQTNFEHYEVAVAERADLQSLKQPTSWVLLQALFSPTDQIKKESPKTSTYTPPLPDDKPYWLAIGVAMLLVGIMLFAYFAFFYERTLPGGPKDVINFGREQNRLIGTIFALFISLLGFLSILATDFYYLVQDGIKAIANSTKET